MSVSCYCAVYNAWRRMLYFTSFTFDVSRRHKLELTCCNRDRVRYIAVYTLACIYITYVCVCVVSLHVVVRKWCCGFGLYPSLTPPVCLVRYLFVISTSVIDCLGRFVPKMTYYVSSVTLNLANSNSNCTPVSFPLVFLITISSDGWGNSIPGHMHVCLCVNQGGTGHKRYTWKCVILHWDSHILLPVHVRASRGISGRPPPSPGMSSLSEMSFLSCLQTPCCCCGYILLCLFFLFLTIPLSHRNFTCFFCVETSVFDVKPPHIV